MAEHETEQAGHWASVMETTCLRGITVLFWVYRRLGAWPFMLCLYPVVLYYWAVNGRARRASLDYLRRLQQETGALGHAPGWRDGLRHFMAFAQTILDKLLAVSGAELDVRMSGLEDLRQLCEQGRGGVIVTAHLGCMELCRINTEMKQSGRHVVVLVHTAHAQRFNRLMRRMQPEAQVEFMEVTDISAATAIVLAQRVERGEFIAMAGDRVPVSMGQTVSSPFLGGNANWPVGPYVLASSFKCPLYAMVCVREPYLSRRFHYQIHAQCLAETVILPRHQRQQALAGHAAVYVQWLTHRLVQSPLAWFNFFDFWRQGILPGRQDTARPGQSGSDAKA